MKSNKKLTLEELKELVFEKDQVTKQNKDRLFKLAKANDDMETIEKLRDKLGFKSAKIYLEKYYHMDIEEAIKNRDLKSLKRVIENGTDVSHINLVELVKKKYPIEYFQILLKAESNIYKTDDDGRTALVVAIMQNYTELVNMLLNNGANANDKAYSGETALQIASSLGNEDIVTSLLEYEADINSVTNDKLTPLLLAVWKNHLPVVKKLLANGANLNIVDIYGVTPLIRASCEGHFEIVKFLIDQGVDINQADNNGITALMEANDLGHTDIQVLLLEHGAELIFDELEDMKINLEPLTPLMIAVVKNNLDKIEELLEQKTDITIKVSDENHPYFGKTALEIAYIAKQLKLDKLINLGKVITYERDGKQKVEGHPNDMGLLMHYDEAINMIEEYFFISPSDSNVKTKNDFDDVKLLITATQKGDYDTVNKLLASGTDINAAINDNWTPLLIASNFGDYKMIKLLIDNNVNVDCKLKDGTTAIFLAALGNKEIVKLLIDSGIDINHKHITGYNSLMIAIKSHHSDIAKELILCGIDINTFSWDEGETALSLAILHDNIEIVKLLLERGVKVNQLKQGYYTVLDLCIMQNKKEFIDLLVKNGAKKCNLSDINKKPVGLILNDDLIVEDIFHKVDSTITSPFIAKQFILEEIESVSSVPEEDNPTAKEFADNSGFSSNDYKGALGRSLPEVDGATGGQQILNKWIIPYMFSYKNQSHQIKVVKLRYKILNLIMKKYSLGKYSTKVIQLDMINERNIKDTYSIFVFTNYLIDNKSHRYEQITDNRYYNQEYEKYMEIDNNKISIYTKTYDEIGHKTEYTIIDNKEIYEYEFENYIIEIKKQNMEHDPKALMELLKKFSSDNRLMYTNHPWSDKLTHEEFDNKLNDGWREIQNDLKVLSPTLYDYINEFLFEEDNESAVGFSSNLIKEKLKDGTKPDSIKELTEAIVNFKQNIVIKNDENLTLLDLFDRIIEKLDLDLDIDIDLEGIENFTTKLFTDVRKIEDAIVIILKDIYKMNSNASIKVIAGKNPDNEELIDLKIIHIDSKYLSESIELLNTIGKTGNFTTIYDNLKSVCHWDIEVACSDGKKRIEYLFPLKDNEKPHLIPIPDKIEGFTHILRLYK